MKAIQTGGWGRSSRRECWLRLGFIVPWRDRDGARVRSADFQSAVSQNCILPSADKFERLGIIQRSAECNSAIQQIENLRYSRIPVLLMLVAWLFVPLALTGQSVTDSEAISRELSLFNFGLPSAPVEAISREVSVFNFGAPSAPVEAISREVSVVNLGQPSAPIEAISREVSVVNLGGSSANLEAISREVSVFNLGQPTAPIEAISREVSVLNLPPLSCVPPPTGLIAWWPGDGNANDLAGTNNGTLFNGATFDQGRVEQAFRFDGVNDVVSFGHNVGDFGTNDFAISFWIKTASARDEAMLSKRLTCGYANFWEFLLGYPSAGRLYFDAMESGGGEPEHFDFEPPA